MIQNKEKQILIQRLSKITAVVLGFLILILTLLRENLFLEINAIIDGYSYNNAYFYFFNESITDLTASQLALLKWCLTVFFIGFISGLTLLIIHLWFNNKNFNRTTMYIYLAFYGIIGMVTISIGLMDYYADYYFVIRKMIGFLQSPLPLFLFFAMYIYLMKVGNKP